MDVSDECRECGAQRGLSVGAEGATGREMGLDGEGGSESEVVLELGERGDAV